MSREGDSATVERKSLGGKVLAGSIAAVVANVLYLASRVLLTPVILAYVSLAEYGLWSFCFVILAYAGMTAFGVNNAYIKYTAQYLSDGTPERIGRLISTGLVVMSGISLLLFSGIYAIAPWLIELFSIAPSLVPTATTMLVGTASIFLLDSAMGGFRGLLEGAQEVALCKKIWLATSIFEAILVVLFIVSGSGIMGVLYAFIIKTLLDIAVSVHFAYQRVPGMRLSFGLLDKAALKKLFVYGGKVQFIGLVGMFMASLDRIVLTRFSGLAAVGMFEVGRKFPFTARGITGSASAPFMPAVSFLGGWWVSSPDPTVREKIKKYGGICFASLSLGCFALLPWSGALMAKTGVWGPVLVGAVAILTAMPGGRILWELFDHSERFDSEEVREFYLRGSRYLNLINGVVYFYLMACADSLIFAWVGPGYEEAYGVCVLVAIMNVIHMGTAPCSSLVRGVNRVGRELEAMLVNLVLLLVWLPVFTMDMGLMGTVLSLTASTSVSSFYFILRTNRALRISLAEYARRTLLPCIYPAFPALAIHHVFGMLEPADRWTALFRVMLLGLFYLIASLLLIRFFGLDKKEWTSFSEPVLGRLARLRLRPAGKSGMR